MTKLEQLRLIGDEGDEAKEISMQLLVDEQEDQSLFNVGDFVVCKGPGNPAAVGDDSHRLWLGRIVSLDGGWMRMVIGVS